MSPKFTHSFRTLFTHYDKIHTGMRLCHFELGTELQVIRVQHEQSTR